MTSLITNPVELRQQGFTALVAALGWVNAVRFLQQYDVGRGDYTQERYQFLPDWDAETLVRKARDAFPDEQVGTLVMRDRSSIFSTA